MVQVTNNSPSAGYIAWKDCNISYKGTVYPIPDGNTNLTYVYWKFSDPDGFYGSNAYPTLAADDLLVFLNKNGIHLKVPNTSVLDGSLIVPESIYADALAANIITTEHLMAGAVTTNKLSAGAVTANTIAADAIGATAIAADAILSEHIQANQIIAEHLAVNSVTARVIAADAIGADAIAANAVLAEHIKAGTITTNHISSAGIDVSKVINAATSSQISQINTRITDQDGVISQKATQTSVNLLTGRMTTAEGKITTQAGQIDLKVDRDGVIAAINLQPGSVTIDARLVNIADTTNLVDNSTFEDDVVGSKPKGWDGGLTVSQAGWGSNTGSNNAMQIDANNTRNTDIVQEKFIEVSAGDQLYLEMDYRNLNLLGSGGMYIGTKNYDAKKQHIGWGAVTAITTKTTTFKKQSGTYTVPANVSYVQIRVTFSNNGETTNKLYVDNLIVRRKNNADLIVEGAITANHLAANSITAANGALANASITRAKLQNAIIGTAQIEDGTITNAKIGNLAVDNAKISGISANKINAGYINGIDVYGAKFRSSDGLTNLEIIGGNVRLTQTGGSYVNMNPDGVYGYNSSGSERFRMDKGLITSAALGTSNSNVYLAPDSANEVRVVDLSSIPSDGIAENYSYRPIRVQGVRFAPNGNGYLGTEGEIRITSSGFQQPDGSYVYRPLRAGNIYGTSFISSTTNAYIGADNEVRFVNKGFIDGDVSTPTYRPLRCGDITAGHIASDSGNMYVGSDDEVRIVSRGGYNGGNITWRNLRSNLLYANAIDINTGTHVYIRPTSGGEAKVTSTGTTGDFRPIRARTFTTDTSMRENKKDIEVFSEDSLDIFRNAQIYTYRRLNDDPFAFKQLGMMIDETPRIIHGEAGDSFDLYALTAYMGKGIKDIITITDKHSDDINWLKIENQYLKQKVQQLEDRLGAA
ncbi:hypothetical protein ACIQY5_15570 [Peribacillus frigoritolerans]|uniref:hypothetical protein n=1 Tax=Peribacillus frigoritolerans TaxID=450367 RepID=UPI003828CAFB